MNSPVIHITSIAEARTVAYEFAVLTDAIRQSQERRQQLRLALIEYMGEARTNRVQDLESGVLVERRERAGRKSWDVASMPPTLVIAVNAFSALRVDNAAAKLIMPAVLGDMEPCLQVGEPTNALFVRHPEERTD